MNIKAQPDKLNAAIASLNLQVGYDLVAGETWSYTIKRGDDPVLDGFFTQGVGQGAPTPADIVCELVNYSAAIEFPTFEAWAGACWPGTYPPLARLLYSHGRNTAARFIATIGDKGLAQLREASQDF